MYFYLFRADGGGILTPGSPCLLPCLFQILIGLQGVPGFPFGGCGKQQDFLIVGKPPFFIKGFSGLCNLPSCFLMLAKRHQVFAIEEACFGGEAGAFCFKKCKPSFQGTIKPFFQHGIPDCFDDCLHDVSVAGAAGVFCRLDFVSGL